MAVSLLAAPRQEHARARHCQLPPQPGTPGGTRLPGQTRPCPWVVQDILLTLPSPARPRSGSGSPASCPGLRLPHQPSPAGKGCPRAGCRGRAHRTLDRVAGSQWPSPGRSRLLPQAGRTPPWVPTCPRSLGAVPRAPGPGKGVGEAPGRPPGWQREGAARRPSHLTGQTGSGTAAWSTPAAGDGGHVGGLGKPPPPQRGVTWKCKQGPTRHLIRERDSIQQEIRREIRCRAGPHCPGVGRKQEAAGRPPARAGG